MNSKLENCFHFTFILLGSLVGISFFEIGWGQTHDQTPLKEYPWEPCLPRNYQRDPLTESDWVGADGIIYPNWTWAGIHRGKPGNRERGIPQRIDIFSRIPNSLEGKERGELFTKKLHELIEQCGKNGGGVIEIDPGTFYLTHPLLIRYNRVVIRGAGRSQLIETEEKKDIQETKIIFDFNFGNEIEHPFKVLSFPFPFQLTPQSYLTFYASPFSPKASAESKQREGKNSHVYSLEIIVTRSDQKNFRIGYFRDSIEEKRRKEYDLIETFSVGGPTSSWGLPTNRLWTFLMNTREISIQGRVSWRWQEGQKKQEDYSDWSPRFVFRCNSEEEGFFSYRPINAAFYFIGNASSSDRTRVVRNAKRGDRILYLQGSEEYLNKKVGIKSGSVVIIWVYSTAGFKAIIERDGGGGTNRSTWATVVRCIPTEDPQVTMVELEQPLPFDLPSYEEKTDEWNPKDRMYKETGIYPSWVRTVLPLEECGIENLVIVQTYPIWFDGIVMDCVMNSWIRNVRVERAGRDPIRVSGMMNEVRNCELIDPRWSNNTGGGSAYLHGSHYGLYENIYGQNMRHAPNFSGTVRCVIRNSRFLSSDLQWHMNWGIENLVENCTIDALQGTGSYGYAAFAQRNIAEIHGPGMGHRNVIYNCELIGIRGGIFFGGKTENPMVLFSKIHARQGPVFILRYHVFNGIFLGNTLLVEDRFSPAVLFGDPDPKQSRLPRNSERPHPLYHPGLGGANPGNDFILNTIYGGTGEIASGTRESGRITSSWRLCYGNKSYDWNPAPPRSQPIMESVFEAQLKNPKGFVHLSPEQTLYYNPHYRNSPPLKSFSEKVYLIAQINFQPDKKEKTTEYLKDLSELGGDWFIDTGKPFQEQVSHQGKIQKYGWVGGTPYLLEEATWSSPYIVCRTSAFWGIPDAHFKVLKEGRKDLLYPFRDWMQVTEYRKQIDLFWQIQLDPGTYFVFLVTGNARRPERFCWPEETPLPFIRIHDFFLNDRLLTGPRYSDVRQNTFWVKVEIGEEKLLKLRPAPTAIDPCLAFIQIYRVQ